MTLATARRQLLVSQKGWKDIAKFLVEISVYMTIE